MFRNRMLRKTFGPKTDEANMTGRDGIMKCFVTCNLTPIIREIRWKRMRWTGQVASLIERRGKFTLEPATKA